MSNLLKNMMKKKMPPIDDIEDSGDEDEEAGDYV